MMTTPAFVGRVLSWSTGCDSTRARSRQQPLSCATTRWRCASWADAGRWRPAMMPPGFTASHRFSPG